MPGLLIIAHAPLASALKAAAAHVYPDCTVEAVDVPAQGPLPEAEAAAALARVRDPQALILTDVFGATPCNLALKLADGVQVRVVTGVNVPMLWRTLCYRTESAEDLVARAVAGATQGVMQVAVSRPQNQSIKPGDHAQDHAHHQQ
jgi:mannose PTS system EIIA component